MIINGVLWFDEPVDWTAYRTVVQERLVERFDRFSQRPVEGVTAPHWRPSYRTAWQRRSTARARCGRSI
jgi:hypothetical protein